MEIYPRIFTRNIETTFGEEGRLWLKNLKNLFENAVSKWNLTDCRPVDNLSFNYVCTAESPLFGPVILKMGLNGREVDNEYRALQRFASEKTCRCYDYDRELQAFLLERILPGDDLYSLESVKEQIDEGTEILRATEREVLPGDDFPNYRDWLKKSFSSVRNKYKDTIPIEPIFQQAEDYFTILGESGLPVRLLHGDFHHQNILRNKEGQWVLIDPQGVVGYRTSECGRFILNQLNILRKEDHYSYLKMLAEAFARVLDTSEDLILKGSLIEYTLSCSWSLEGEINDEERDSILSRLVYTRKLHDSLLKEYKGQ